ncbi:UvrD-helicase domain-containing protein [Fusobacterium pseudoperiodonticum]|uniref:UvrD-helicase domain-containing protein n=1 Tax=Fusobacterium pseudoperiodonticum TaxID=2663009 RepID=UPI000C1BE8B8|nr:UvrD-helicase domain-containing protein [Fusobacterium pseudoperiodonticum]ATV63107.1 DNA helicase UvrD [Fusobacterium pseudoperiodonticum]
MDTRTLEDEVKIALQCIEKGKNFILEGGAGSGKTYSLISLIETLSIKSPKIKIVCITYTNNAVAEIKSRIDNENLWVSTIHEFIWYMIKKYQKEIKNELVLLINDETIKNFKKPKKLENTLITIDYFDNIDVEYDEYYSMNPSENKVKISHDHILILAEKMFNKYKKLSDILKDTANCIFVDEYQDTSPYIAEILLKHLKKSKKKNVIGFFGDSMQSIYDEGVGDLNEYRLKKIVKKQNRRNPRIVIEIANKFRDDKIEQIPSKDKKAPNMDENGVIIEGNIKFIYGKEPEDINFLKNKALFKSWDFLNGQQTRELRLTHKYNAEMAGFKKLYDLYNDDLIILLIDKIKKNVDNNENEKKSLNELVLELRPTHNRKDLFEEIISNEIYNLIYQDIKNLLWKDVLEKCKINKESLMSYKFNGISGRYEANSYRDKILKKLDVLNELIELYESKKFNEFLKKTNFSIQNKNDKSKLKEIMNYFILEDNKTIEEVLDFSKKQGLIKEDIDFDNYINVKGFYLWKRIKKISFKEYRNSILYLKEFSPISTQHSIKGNEFDNVLVVLESNWNKYDFETLFGKGSRNENVIKRTRKLFYVCITRAKKNLVVYMPTEDLEIVASAKEYFGEENVLSIDSI